ncbi:type II secretion system protein GspG [bacterium]|nr:type II secretion system protein GspG [bacterium]
MQREPHSENRGASVKIRRFDPMVVVFIFAVVVLVARVTLPKPGSRMSSKLSAAIAQLSAFKTMLDAFHDDNGFYPTGANGLQALIRQPIGATNWHGPYANTILKDPWDQDYVYVNPGKHAASGYPYDLASPGPPGNKRTIANWDNPRLIP